MDKQNTVQRFHSNLVDFVDMMLELMPENYKGLSWSLLELGKKYIESYSLKDKRQALITFINKSNKYWSDQIKNKKESFFLEHSNEIFSYFGDKVNIFKSMFEDKKILTQDDKATIWLYIESFVKQSIKFIHSNRQPTRTFYQQKYQNVYTKEFMEDIDLTFHSRMWKVKLEW